MGMEMPLKIAKKPTREWVRHSPRYDAFMAAFLIVLLLVPSVVMVTVYERNTFYDRIEAEVSSYAHMAAELTNAQKLQSLTQPEHETTPAYKEIQGIYSGIFWMMFIINFLAPLLILMRRSSKRNYSTITIMALVIIFGHWLDFHQKANFRLRKTQYKAH